MDGWLWPASAGAWQTIETSLDRRPDQRLDGRDPRIVAPVERPLLDAFGAHETGLYQHAHVFAECRRADLQLFRQQQATDTVLDQVAVDLGPEMAARILQPGEDLQTS